MNPKLYDNHGRPTLNLRVSLTQQCNYQCPYCHREGETSPSAEMSTEEVLRIVGVAVSLGISRVKLTGGEPLLRPDILEIVRGIAGLRGLQDLSMTTNGTLLSSLAKPLRKNGLVRVNVNFPSLNVETYRTLTGGKLEDIVNGIRGAVEAGLYPVKLNMLILRGVNEKDVTRMMSFASGVGAVLQLIELEPVNISASYYASYHYPLDGVEAELERQAYRVETRRYMQNRKVYFLPKVKVEVIHPIENTDFCGSCTRLRVTSDGFLKPCLMRDDNMVDILTPMRNGANDEELKHLFIEAISRRKPYYKAATVK